MTTTYTDHDLALLRAALGTPPGADLPAMILRARELRLRATEALDVGDAVLSALGLDPGIHDLADALGTIEALRTTPPAAPAPAPPEAPSPEAPPERTTRLAKVPAGANTHPHWHIEGRPGAFVIIERGHEGFDAYGFGIYSVPEALGIFPTLDEALAALNAHEPTRARWGRLVLP